MPLGVELVRGIVPITALPKTGERELPKATALHFNRTDVAGWALHSEVSLSLRLSSSPGAIAKSPRNNPIV